MDELVLDNLVQRAIKAMADSGVTARDRFKSEFAALKEKFTGTQLDRLTAVESLVFGKSEASVNDLLTKLIAAENLTVKKLLILAIISKMAATKIEEADQKAFLEALPDNLGASLKFKALAALIRQKPDKKLIDMLHATAPADLKAISSEDFHKLVQLALIEPSMHAEFMERLPMLR